jgi:PAS domain S-box-containing protein
MIKNLRDTTQKNREEDWLKTNLARFSRLLQGQRDLQTVGRLVLSELAPLVGVQRGVIYLNDTSRDDPVLTLLASYANKAVGQSPPEFALGEGLIGQCALEQRRILLTDVPGDYIAISSALGRAAPSSIVVLPVLVENETRAVIELASFERFSETHLSFLEQLTESIGIVLNTIDANRRAEELIQEQAARAAAEAGLARLRQVVDVMPEGILIADATGLVYLRNAAAEEILGLAPAAVISTIEELPAVRLLDGSQPPPRDHPLARAVYGRQVVRGEQLVVTNAASGRDVPILVNSAPLSDARGVSAGGVAVFQDISPLRDLDRQKDEFLAAISHDLKTPATIIKGNANLLQRSIARATSADGVGEIAEGLEAIDESTAQLVRLIDELLDLTRMRMGQPVELDLGPTDLIDLTRRLATEYQKISPRHVIRLETDLRRLVGDWDGARVIRVVANLVSNAVKYSPRGGEITIHASRQDRNGQDWAVLAVRDRGLGIPPGELERIFEPYYRGSNIAGSTSGAGVGLVGTRHIVEQHRGEITVESVVGQGSTFTVRLPVSREHAEFADA